MVSTMPTRQKRPLLPRRALVYAVVATTLVLYTVIARPRLRQPPNTLSTGRLGKRDVTTDFEENRGSLLDIPYHEWYLKTPPALKPLYVVFLVLICALLFCSISITASDFFCPNLATMAAYMGLSETTAGVTLLAFGNGSPDVFSTFATVSQGTFGLAVGELIGAASFITSIVVGSIAMVQPFHVPRVAFLRDVLFFTLAVLLLMSVLADGKLTLKESGGMIFLYVCYVGVVVSGNWWSTRQRRKADYAALGWKGGNEDRDVEQRPAVEVEPATSVGPPVSPTLSVPRPHNRRHSSASSTPGSRDETDRQRAGFSLLGAVEFRDVVNSLRNEMNSPASSRTNSRPSSPSPGSVTPRPHHPHHHSHDSLYIHDQDLIHQMRHHRRSSSQGLAAIEPALSRRSSGGRARATSLHPTWGQRARNSTDYFDTAHRPLESVPGSPSRPVVDPADPHHIPPGALPLSPISSRSNSTNHLTISVPSHPAESPGTLSIPATPTVVASSHDDSRPLTPGLPVIAVVDPEGDFAPVPLSRQDTRLSIQQVRTGFHEILHTVFPSLQGFGRKSLLGMALAVLSVPAIFMLTITLPVVDDGRGDEGGLQLPDDDDDEPLEDAASVRSMEGDRHVGPEVGEGLHHLVESGITLSHMRLGHARSPCPSVSDDCSDCSETSCDALAYSPHLTAAQCIFGPLVCAWLVFQDEPFIYWILLGTIAAGIPAAIATLKFSEEGMTQPWRLLRCCCGFVCSMVWIASIADEVVAVLQTCGEVFGLSDAIIGLTIFAVGNSLADLVANVTIAQFAPNMAYAACFGGPMLNLLLGVGGSGTYSILSRGTHSPVTIDFSPTLWVSATGLVIMLLATAIVVPMNAYLIDRRWALCLLIAYGVLMTVNVIVEVRTGRSK